MNYTPTFTCPYCKLALTVMLSSSEEGSVGSCACEESQEAQKLVERPLRSRQRKTRGRRR